MISELYRIKYILFIELSLLILFAVYGLFPFIVFLSAILLSIIIFLVFKNPVIILYVLFLSILADSFIPMKNHPLHFSLLSVEFFFAIFFVLSITKFLFNLDKKIYVPKIISIWVFFLIWSLLIGLFIALDKYRFLTYWKNYLAGFFIFSLIYYSIEDKIQLKSVIISLIIWGLLLSLIELKVMLELGGFTVGLVGLFFKKNLLTLGWGRSNYLAAFFVIIIPLSIGYMLYTKSKKLKIFIIFTLIFMSFAIILTLSRGGILALILALVILFARVLKARTFIPFLIVLLIITLIILLNPLTYVLFNRISSIETSNSYFSRLNFYVDVWNTFLKHPITGVGFGNLGYYAMFVLPASDSPSAHNIVLGALGEVGIIGSILYFLVFGLLLKNVYFGFRAEKDESLKILRWSFFAALLGGVLHALVEPTFEGLQFEIIFWSLAGISTKLYMLKPSEN